MRILTHVLDRSRDVWLLPHARLGHVLVTDTCARHVWQVDSTTGIMTTLLEPKKKHFFSVSRPTKVCSCLSLCVLGPNKDCLCLCVCDATYQGLCFVLIVLRDGCISVLRMPLFWFRGLGRFVGGLTVETSAFASSWCCAWTRRAPQLQTGCR